MSEQESSLAFFTTPMLFASLYNIQNFMQYNFFSLSKNKRTKSIIHKEKFGEGEAIIEVEANDKYGLATIWDADLLIYFISMVRKAIQKGEKPTPYLTFKAYDYLQFAKRDTGGKSYTSLKLSLARLTNTKVHTTIRRKGTKFSEFSFLENRYYEEKEDGTHLHISVKLSDWLYEGAVNNKDILKINEEYFSITGGLERFLYMVARKHAGKQTGGYEFTFKQLYEKSGSSGSYYKFTENLKNTLKKHQILHTEEDIPQYQMLLIIERKKEPRVKFLWTQHIIDQAYTGSLSKTEKSKNALQLAINIGNFQQSKGTQKSLRMPTNEDFEEIRNIVNSNLSK